MGKVSHAYLFCGTRGTGKTTTALVFAKAINCGAKKNGEPCGTCAPCEAISRGTGFNVIEIDAASNNGVDNIRDIREEVKYPPAEGRYKVYIIDEAHMLSTSAFNALLKTLEEPPEGVIFILATTDPQKIPPTIHSRCQRFDFKRLSLETMAVTVEGYLEAEGIVCDGDAVRYAARIADGSMRDILSVLDQCAAFYMNERITLEKIMEVTGSVGTEALSRLLSGISAGNTASCLEIISNLVKNGKDVHQVTAEFLSHLRDTLIALAAGDSAAHILDLSVEKVNRLREAAAGITAGVLTRFISVFSELVPKMRYAGNPRILLEAECIGLTAEKTEKKEELKIIEKQEIKQEKKQENKPQETEPPDNPLSRIRDEWGGIIAGFGAAERSLLLSTSAEYAGNGMIHVICQNPGIYDILKTKRESLKARIKEKYGFNAEVEFIIRKN